MQLMEMTAEDDLYSGYNNDYHPTLGVQGLKSGDAFIQTVKTGYGQGLAVTGKGLLPPSSAFSKGTAGFRNGTSFRSSLGMTAHGTAVGDAPRPMTAVRGAGYTSHGNRGNTAFDPTNQSFRMHSSLLESKELTPEEKAKQLDRKINQMIEESCIAASNKDFKLALEKAKEASRKEKALAQHREQSGVAAQLHLDLTFSVLFNLAIQYTNCEMYSEALNTYQVIVKNRSFLNAGRLKLNVGNIYVKLGNYPKAIKHYRMALDQVPNTHKQLRIKIMQNIGILFVKMGKYTDAITSFEYIMGEQPNFKTGLSLIVCYHALGDKEKAKYTFQKVLEIPLDVTDDDRYADDPKHTLLLDVIKNDPLRQIEKQMKQEAEHSILAAAKLISPTIEGNFTAGYNWCVDAIKSSSHSHLAYDLEVNKAVMYLKQREYAMAVETFKTLENKETRVRSAAATNLSFLYYLQNDVTQADKYAEMAFEADRYNAGALVNKGCCLFSQGDLQNAKSCFKEALASDATCVEAMHNLGLTMKKLGQLEDAMECFYKLHAILRNQPQVVYQIASIYEQLGDMDQATEWYLQLIGLVSTDPTLLQKMGEIHDNEDDKQQAYQYYYDSYRYFPSNMNVIEWLGAYFIEAQTYEKAIEYFKRASLMQPNEVKWQLMIASCNRRSGNYQQALHMYESIHRKFPENIECLKFLVRLCTDLGLKEAVDYSAELKRAEKLKDVKEQRATSSLGRRGSRPASRHSSASSDSSGYMGSAKANSAREISQLILSEESGPYRLTDKQDIDVMYSDPLGPLAERPRTSARKGNTIPDDDFGNEELGDDLLPE